MSKSDPENKQDTAKGKSETDPKAKPKLTKPAKPKPDNKSKIPSLNLKINQSVRDDGKIVLDVTVPGNQTARIMTNAAFVLAMQNKISLEGVEPDKFIEVVIEQVGEPQYKAFADYYAMNATAQFAITEKAISPIMDPEVNASAELVAGKDFRYAAVVTPKPQYELSSYDPVTVNIPKVVITDKELDMQVYNLAEQSAQTVADEGAVVSEGAEIVFAIRSSIVEDGEPLKALTADRRVYKLGDGYLPEEFDKNLLGLKVGETRTFNFELPGMVGMDGEEGQSKTATTTVTLTQVNKRIIPTINDAWVKANIPEAKDVDGLREMIRKQGQEQKTKESENSKFFLVASALAERFVGSIPDEIYEFTRAEMLQNIKESLKAQNMTMQQYMEQMGMDEQNFNMQTMLSVRESLRQGFALDALARHLKLTINEDDIKDTLTKMAPNREEQVRSEFEGSGRGYILTEAAMRTKANKWLAETAEYIYQD